MTDLNTQFGLDALLRFRSTGQDRLVAELNTRLCTAEIALQGAQVLKWTPRGHESVIWLSNDATMMAGKSIRGGAPICWPWFGAHATESTYPAHGFARTVDWEIVSTEALSDDRIKLIFHLKSNEATRNFWSFACTLELHVLLGTTLELELKTRNDDSLPITITEALHTYFNVGDVRQVSVLGLDGCDYLDKVRGFARYSQQGPVTFHNEVDRVYLNTELECIIDDAGWQRRVHIRKRGSQSTIVWNPWHDRATEMGDMGQDGYLNMLCVESGNTAENNVTIEPGGEHCLWVEYRIEKYT